MDTAKALDILLEYVEGYDPSDYNLGWALQHLEPLAPKLLPHEQRLLEDSWDKIKDDADRRDWIRMGERR